MEFHKDPDPPDHVIFHDSISHTYDLILHMSHVWIE